MSTTDFDLIAAAVNLGELTAESSLNDIVAAVHEQGSSLIHILSKTPHHAVLEHAAST